MNELKKKQIEQFWSIYEVEGSVQALSWLETLKYYEDYCNDDICQLINQMSQLKSS